MPSAPTQSVGAITADNYYFGTGFPLQRRIPKPATMACNTGTTISRDLAMKYRLPVQAGLMLASLLLVSLVHSEELFDAEGYRSSQYRSPTPSTLEGVQILDTPALKKLLDERPDVQLIDVYRQLWRHDRFIEEEPHANIPGSLWLPNTGSGNLEALWLRYFTHYLSQASKGDLNKPLVFYCRPDCWPSWNAARRAHAMGYRQLYWYRDGIDAWEQAGLPMAPAQPAELPAAFFTPTATP